MTLKIQRNDVPGSTIFVLRGRLKGEHIEELQALLDSRKAGAQIVLDLKEVRLVDREAVAFLAKCEAAGITLKDCPDYIREWITGMNTN